MIRCKHPSSGVTVIEVLFSMGVILIGLLGVVALIPVAGRDAREAVRLDAAFRLADAVASELQARELRSLEGLVYLDIDPENDDGLSPLRVINNPAPQPDPGGNTEFGQVGMRALSNVIIRPSKRQGNMRQFGAPLDSPGFVMSFVSGLPPAMANTYRVTPLASFCLDPDFLSKNSVGNLGETRNAYQPSRFSYYSEWYLGLEPPSNPFSGVGSTPPIPRMYRVGVGGMGSFVQAQIAEALTRSDAALMMYRPQDKSVPASQVLRNMDFAGITAGARLGSGRYTWIATITPPLIPSNHYHCTVVVIESREVVAGLYNVGNTPGNPSAKTNPSSERVFWVSDPVQLGSTIEVTAYGPATVDDSIRPGEWVMLSRQRYALAVSGVPERPLPAIPAEHRWYRVQRVMPTEPALPIAPFTGGVPDVWQRTVVLEGPQWQFGNQNNAAPGSPPQVLADDTFMTVVSGAVAIKEFTLDLPF